MSAEKSDNSFEGLRGSGSKRALRSKRAVSEEMKAWSAALAAEVEDWPGASARIFFGFTALYRGDAMFAALPLTRLLATPTSLIFKFHGSPPSLLRRLEADGRIAPFQKDKARWFTFDLSSGSDLHAALAWLGLAYEAAAAKKKSKKKSK